MTTGAIIKAYRERNHLTQEAVATYLGIKREMLSMYETEEREASLEILEKLSNLYGADLLDFFEIDIQQINTNVAFAFRAGSINDADLPHLAAFKKVIKNYFKILELEKSNG